MLNKVVLLMIILVSIFIITSLMTFITLEKVVTPEKVEIKKQDTANLLINIKEPPKTAGGMVVINIVKPNTSNI